MTRRLSAMCIIVFVAAVIAANSTPAEPAFHKELKQIAADYLKWGRVDDEVRWAPELCRSPMPGRAYPSESEDDKTHGKKLYSVFAKDRGDYVRLSSEKKQPVNQVIVKQSWIPKELSGKDATDLRKQINERAIAFSSQVIITPQEDRKPSSLTNDHFLPYAMKDDKVFKATKQADLFIMMKLDPKTADTDDGWVYGTVTPDGKTITAEGKIESCMKCHVKAKYDRLFGLPETK